MKILIISSSHVYGGGEVYVTKLVKLLKDEHNVDIICRNKNLYEELSVNINNGSKLLYRPYKSSIKFLVAISSLIYSLTSEKKYDLVILNGQLESNLALYLKTLGLKTLNIRHTELRMASLSKRLLFYLNCQFLDTIVCVSKTVQSEFPTFLLKKTVVIDNWIEVNQEIRYSKAERYEVYLNSKQKFIIYYIGRVVADKNIEDLILATKNIDGIELNIVGEGDLLNSLKSNYSDLAVFHGFIEKKSLNYHYERAHLFVSCSSFESFGLTVLEASCYSIPLVLSDIPAFKEITSEGKNAILFTLHDTKQLNSIINHLKSDRSELLRLSKRSTEIAQNYSAMAAKRKFIDLLDTLHQ